MNIAIIKTAALGDVVRTTSILPVLAQRFPASQITWVTSPGALPLLAANRLVRAVSIDSASAAPWRSTEYDWIISLDDDRASCEVATRLNGARLSGAYVNAAGNCAYTNDLAGWFGMGILRPDALGGLAAANELKRANTRTYGELLYEGLDLPLPVARPIVALTPAAAARAARWLASRAAVGTRFVGINTGAAGRWRFKSWGVDETATLATRVAETGATVLILGGAAETDRNHQITTRAGHVRVVEGPSDFDLLSFAALVARCDLLVCSDSLAMHLAIAARRPVVALFGPTSDAEIDLFGAGEKVVAPLACRRCYLSTCDVQPNCMQVITPELVMRSIPAAAVALAG